VRPACVLSVLGGGACYANRVRGKSPLPAFKAGDIVAWRIDEDAGRIEASFNGAPFVAVFSGLTAPIVAAGFDLYPGSSVRFISDGDVSPGEWVGNVAAAARMCGARVCV
jgi:hypothetical protein